MLGGFTIEENILKSKNGNVGICSSIDSGEDAFWAGESFTVTNDGRLTATNVEISGTINATSGCIGGFSISNSSLSSSVLSISTEQIYLPTQGCINLNNNVYLKNVSSELNNITGESANIIESRGQEDFIISNNGGAGLILKKTAVPQKNKLALCLSWTHTARKTGSDSKWDYYAVTIMIHYTCYSYNQDGTINYNDESSAYNGDSSLTKTIAITYSFDGNTESVTKVFEIPRGQHTGVLYTITRSLRSVKNSGLSVDVQFSQQIYSLINESMTNNVMNSIGSIFPYTENGYTAGMLGDSSHPWATLATSNFVIVTSDRKKKHDIHELKNNQSYSEMFDHIKPVYYKFNDGKSDRFHIGFIAQDVEDAISISGLTSKDFGGLVKNINESGSTDYALRYEEFIALNTFEIQKLKKRVNELESKLKEIQGE